MHKHLTTPWEAKGGYVFAGKDCIAICDTDNADQATYEAKAKLMAAAPELLRQLKAARRTINSMGADLQVAAPRSVNGNTYQTDLRRIDAALSRAGAHS